MKVRYVLKNKNTGYLHIRHQYLAEIELGLHNLFDIENYDIISRDLYIGKEDKNGIELYAGDIIDFETLHQCSESEYERSKGYIVFENGTFRIKGHQFWNDGNHEWYSIENMDFYVCEKIGNIHQNPGLLEC